MPNYAKSELKRMYLRVLYECLYGGGTMQGHSWGVDSIVPHWMNEKFEISLTDEQVQLTFQAIDELRRDGFLVKDATQKTDNFLVLTPEGKTLVEKQEDPDVHGIRLEQIVVDKELLKGSLEPFNDGNYEQAIFLAYKHIEERVRSYAKADAKDIGVHLITLA